MNVLSLFDGMSCGRIAFERAGVYVDSYFASEIDKYSMQVAMKNYPDTIQVGNITKLRHYNADNADVVIGGSPCQSFSRGGDGTGFDGKSGLFYEYVRLLNECNPKYFILENVVMKKEWENIITSELGVSPIMIDSKLVSAQKRQRMYWTNIPDVTQPDDKNILLSDIVQGEREIITDHPLVLEKHEKYLVIKNGTKKGYLIACEGDSVNLEVPNSKTRRGRVGIDKTNTLNTACNYGMVRNGELVRLNISDYELLQGLPLDYTLGVSENQRRKMIGNGWNINTIAHIVKNIK